MSQEAKEDLGLGIYNLYYSNIYIHNMHKLHFVFHFRHKSTSLKCSP